MTETTIRLLFFSLALLFFALLESYFPKRKLQLAKNIRWKINFSLIIFNNLTLRVIVPIGSIAVSLYARQNQIGLFNQLSELNPVLVILLSVMLLDLIIYFQHLVFHYFSWLWRFHKVHHIDQEIDVSTGLRFHPIEIILSLLLKYSAVLIFGISATALVIFEILLNFMAMFNHSNFKIQSWLDFYLRQFVVTPDMHRIHHSVIVCEMNSNFGFNLSLWDRLFRTYKQKPKHGHKKMKIGLSEYPDIKKTGFLSLLKLPFNK